MEIIVFAFRFVLFLLVYPLLGFDWLIVTILVDAFFGPVVAVIPGIVTFVIPFIRFFGRTGYGSVSDERFDKRRDNHKAVYRQHRH